jgi:tripartite-type tricarboxylate transporter receptor subunit TctC
LARELGTRFNLIPYTRTGPAMTDVIAGRVDFVCDAVITAAPQARAGSVKAYGIVGARRSPIVPDLPTLAEQGLAGATMQVWSGLYAPKGTPPAVIGRLSAALDEVLADPAFADHAVALGQDLVPPELTRPDGAAAFLHAEIEKWTPLLKGRRASE